MFKMLIFVLTATATARAIPIPTAHTRRAKQQAAQKGQSDEAKRKEKMKAESQAKKDQEARFKAEKAALFQPVQYDQKAPFGVDPKTIVCINFKNGFCERLTKCKFSHDLNAGRKVEKKDLYTDTRDGEEDGTTVEGDNKKEGECMLGRSLERAMLWCTVYFNPDTSCSHVRRHNGELDRRETTSSRCC
jgi:hypothetical protein